MIYEGVGVRSPDNRLAHRSETTRRSLSPAPAQAPPVRTFVGFFSFLFSFFGACGGANTASGFGFDEEVDLVLAWDIEIPGRQGLTNFAMGTQGPLP